MAQTVVLLRHAAPEVDPEISSAAWPLSADGRLAARQLRGQLPEGMLLASSPERKAVETLCLAAESSPDRLVLDARFGEVRRDEPFAADHQSRRLAWVRNELDERHLGWESPVAAADRFQRGLEAIDSDGVIVATHGMVLTAWLVSRGVLEPGAAAGASWSRLQFPEIVTVPRTDGPAVDDHQPVDVPWAR